jgi:N-acylglucosamine 2-epimerase/mannose-6-phosphate isomerase
LVLPQSDAIRKWVFDVALPWWAANGVDRGNGGYVEQVTPDGRDAAIAFKRTRVTARQIYAFSHGYVLGFSPGLELAQHGVDFLVSRTWNGPGKAFARKLTREGGALDPTPDLYDLAFVLFAFAWHHKASSNPASRDWMHRTLDYIESHMRVAGGEGFWHELPAKGWRQQNPHMHLTEACLAAFDATGEARFATVARELVSLFTKRFFDLESRTLAEYFTDDLKRAPGDDGRICEPGHQLEWSWILNASRKQLGLQLAPHIRALATFAERHGVDPATGVTFNTMRDDGTPIDRGSRTWPNCERIKAAVALHELDGVDPAPVIGSAGKVLFERHLARSPSGTWFDQFDADGRPANGNVPASTLYHLMLAFAEVLRASKA